MVAHSMRLGAPATYAPLAKAMVSSRLRPHRPLGRLIQSRMLDDGRRRGFGDCRDRAHETFLLKITKGQETRRPVQAHNSVGSRVVIEGCSLDWGPGSDDPTSFQPCA